jgi:hypothetical protein
METRKFSRIFAGVIAVAAAFTPAIADAQTHFLPSAQDVLRSCATALNNGELPVDLHLPRAVPNSLPKGAKALREFLVPLLRQPDHAQEALTCSNFGWADIAASRFGTVTIAPDWAAPSFASSAPHLQGWDCNHSTIQYGVFSRPVVFFPSFFRHLGLESPIPLGSWTFIGGGQLWGWPDTDECTHAVTDPLHRYTVPSGWGRNQEDTTAAIGLRIGVISWSHNDPALGHSGNECADTECWWPTTVHITGQR